MDQNAQLITVIGGVVIPILVGLITKARASSGLKAILNAGLSGCAGALATVQLSAWSWKAFGVAWGSTWAVSVASYYGLLKPTGITTAVQEKTAGVGVG